MPVSTGYSQAEWEFSNPDCGVGGGNRGSNQANSTNSPLMDGAGRLIPQERGLARLNASCFDPL